MTFSWDEGDSLSPLRGHEQRRPAARDEGQGRLATRCALHQRGPRLRGIIALYNGNAIGIELPPSVVLQITASEPGIKGDTASGATKPATLSTGTTVNVPLFIKEGEWVKIGTTRTGAYLERVNWLEHPAGWAATLPDGASRLRASSVVVLDG